jgi:hypothetical protein
VSGQIQAGAGVSAGLFAGQAGEVGVGRRHEHVQGVGRIDLITGGANMSGE